MSGNRICLLDANTCGPGLYVREGALSLMSIANALVPFNTAGTHPSVMGDVAAISGVYFLEAIYWSTSRGSFANQVALGIGQPGCSMLKYPGEEANSYGFRPADGRIDNNGAAIVTGLTPIPERVVIGMYLFLSGSVATLTFAVGGTAIGSPVTLPLNKIWYPMFALSGATAGDLRWQVNCGQYLFEAPLDPTGWNEQTPGLSTFYVSLAVEAFMSAIGDSPSNTSYSPDWINGDTFSARRAVVPWPQRTDTLDKAPLSSAFAPILLKNTDGKYSPLLFANTRDSIVTVDAIDAPAMSQGSLASATRVLTANIDQVLAPDANTIQINLKDNIARMDTAMKMHLIPDFADASAAGKFMPWGVGVQRNFNPVEVEQATLTFLLGDATFTAVPLVMDNAAPLDPLSPQFAPAPYLGVAGRALTLNQPPAGKVSCDGSTVGTYTPSGNPDILGGIGAFTTFTSGVPNGWTKAASPTYPSTVYTNGTIAQTTAYGGSALLMTSNVPYTPSGVGFYYGYPITVTSFVLQPGKTYRVSFNLKAIGGDYRENFGLAVIAGAADDERYWITDFRQPLKVAGVYAYEITIPPTFGQLPIIVWLISKTGGAAPTTQSAFAVLDDFVVEELGQYANATLQPANLVDAFKNILVTHQNEPTSIYSASDLAALQASGVSADYPLGIVWGIRKTDAPNVASVMQEILDIWCACMFTDALNQIRFARLIAPEEGTPLALFNTSNINLDDPSSFTVNPDGARALTTLFGGGRNCDPNGDTDFVTDTGLVPLDRRQALSRTSQYEVEATVKPAGEYDAARSAPRFHTLIDGAAQTLAQGNSVVRIWAQRIIGAQLVSGKRSLVSLTVNYAGLNVGAGPTIPAHQLYPLACVTIDLPPRGLSMKAGIVLSTEIFPVQRKLKLEVLV